MRMLQAIACVIGLSLAVSAVAAESDMTGPPPAPTPAMRAAGAPMPPPPPAINRPPSLELLFTPIAPCRAFSTSVTGGRLAVNEARQFSITGTKGYAAQGGPRQGCGVPAYATAIALSLTTDNSAGTGHLRAYAVGAGIPPTQALSFRSGAGETTSQIVQIGQGRIVLKAYSAGTGVSGDITGYYTPQIHGLLYTGGGDPYSATPAILSVTKISTGVADATIDRDVTYCTVTTTSYYDKYYYSNARTFNGNTVRIYSWYLDWTSHAPTYIDNYIFLSVNC